MQRLTLEKLDDQGCLNVVCAMVAQMAKELRFVYASYLSDTSDKHAYSRYIKVRNEFLSDYFSTMTKLDGKAIVESLERIVRDEVKSQAQDSA